MNLVFLARLVKYVGVRNTLSILTRRLRSGKPEGDVYELRTSGIGSPLSLRLYSSDSGVFSAVFHHHDYACVADQTKVDLIVDCGANVGYSSVYFLNKFPTARLIAIEPDPGNFKVLQRNLAAYGNRATAVASAVWSHPARVTMDDQPFRDGREWSQHVRECRPGEPGFVATDIGTVLESSGAERISILKIDVERAEIEIFSRNYETWIGRVDALVIELHDDACRAQFAKAIAGVPFQVTEDGELTVCRRTPSHPQ